MESLANDMLPDVEYKETETRKRARKELSNDGNALEVIFSAKTKSVSQLFLQLLFVDRA